MSKRILLFTFVSCFLSLFSYSQTDNDSLKKIFASPSFSLLEDYSGDWGSDSHIFIFTQKDTCEEVLWKDPHFPDGETPRELKIILSKEGMKKLEKLFSDCQAVIPALKNSSTEHSKYIFKDKTISYTIDDNFTMICVNSFKEWKKALFVEGLKQEKKKVTK